MVLVNYLPAHLSSLYLSHLRSPVLFVSRVNVFIHLNILLAFIYSRFLSTNLSATYSPVNSLPTSPVLFIFRYLFIISCFHHPNILLAFIYSLYFCLLTCQLPTFSPGLAKLTHLCYSSYGICCAHHVFIHTNILLVLIYPPFLSTCLSITYTYSPVKS